MTGWTHSPFQRKRNDESPSNDFSRPSQTSRRPETTIELRERGTSQLQEASTETSPERAPNATESPTSDTNIGHVRRLQEWWSQNVRLNLEYGAPGGDPRDYLALERTFLGWVRTSVALISFGVLITQLFVLKDVNPKTGKILGAIMSCGGIVVVLLGCVRYFEQQRLLTLGKALSGGWHHQVLITTLFLILIILFVVVFVDK